MLRRQVCALFGVIAISLAGLLANSTPAQAGSGTIQLELYKAAFIIGATGGRGTLTFEGNSYPISAGGISAGFSFAASKAQLSGKVKNINRPEDIAGVYTAAGAGLAVAGGAQAAVMTNAKGVTIELLGTQMGVDFSINLEGLSIRLK